MLDYEGMCLAAVDSKLGNDRDIMAACKCVHSSGKVLTCWIEQYLQEIQELTTLFPRQRKHEMSIVASLEFLPVFQG